MSCGRISIGNLTSLTAPPSSPAATVNQQPQIQPQPQVQRSISSTVVRPIPSKIQPQLWKPWLYSASLYQDWISRLSQQQNLNFAISNSSSMAVGEANTNIQNKNHTIDNKAGILQLQLLFKIKKKTFNAKK